MKTVLLAGGLGTRLAEETDRLPKPMVPIGGLPILWHIIKMYSHHGLSDFIICCGYKGHLIKEYFSNYYLHMCDVTFDMRNGNNTMEVHTNAAEPWRITLIDTGLETMTGGRLKRARPYLTPGEPFCMTYGDGVSDVDIGKLIAFHKSHGKLSTVTSVMSAGRFGVLKTDGDRVTGFGEKTDGYPINAGFFVLQPEVLDLIDGDETIWEQEPMRTLVDRDQMMVHAHRGFWQPMDTLRDRQLLEGLWNDGKAPWKVWNDKRR